MKWFCFHRWAIIPPIGIGPTYSIAWCCCIKCGTKRERYLTGKEDG